ncbi:MAG: M20/M25/M40 family metallo-hydrolase [candidate division Zixibacteria bacterium]|nr:M20/M25/M40 family metallo-hydrolase [candidate division Zixibacteria bacterium]
MRDVLILITLAVVAASAAGAERTLAAVTLERPAQAYELLARGVPVVEARPSFALVLTFPDSLGLLDGYAYVDLGVPPGPVYLAWPRPGEKLPEVAGVAVLAQLGGTYVVSGEAAAVERLATLGAELKRVGVEPLKAPRDVTYPRISYDPLVGQMVARVRADRYFEHIEKLAAIKTRYSYAEEIEKAAAYIEEHFRNLGYETSRRPYVYQPNENDYFADSVFRAGGRLGWVLSTWGYVWRSDDRGRTWKAYKSEGRLDHGCFVTDDVGFVVGGLGFLARTDDGGRTWKQLELEDPSDYLRDVYFFGTARGVAAGDRGAVYRTADGGATWRKVATPTKKLILGVYAQTAAKWWALGMEGLVMRSYDGGATWKVKNVPQTEGFGMRRMAFADATHAAIVGNEGTILYSEDAGETWRRVSGYFPAWPFFTEVAFADDKRGWAAGSSGKVYRTDDGGANWTRQRTPFGDYYTYTGISIVGREEAWVVGGPAAIIHTTDGGESWEAVKMINRDPIMWDNVEATKRGGGRGDETYVLCGHYDSISQDPWNRAPGAEDNASGTAALLEAATALADFRFDRTLKFVAFSGEEEGLIGSRAYAREEYEAGADIRGVFNMDMISYLDEPVHDVRVHYNEFSRELLSSYREAARLYVPACVVRPMTGGRGGSDHESFWDYGYPALLSIEYAGKEFYPWYHTTEDLPKHLTPAFGADVTRVNLAAAASLAGTRAGPLPPSEVVAYPNPAKPSKGHGHIRFAGVAPGSSLVLYDLGGAEVWATVVDESGLAEWPLITAGGNPAASGVYLFVSEDRHGAKRFGKVAVIK